MAIWAAVVALALVVLALLIENPSNVLSGLVELGAVVALFILVCLAEAWN